ncbi:hypothetical protein JB92DRAFT_674988 [Gautieria morchelliformis]|nr:hypothetical protein JB92DRAFT_674988 [Gautieria morchelliformis]
MTVGRARSWRPRNIPQAPDPMSRIRRMPTHMLDGAVGVDECRSAGARALRKPCPGQAGFEPWERGPRAPAGMVEGVLNTTVQSIIILHPGHPVDDSLFLSSIGLALYTPIIVDCILILRLSAVYPASVTPRTYRIPILAVPQLCTIARVICVSSFVRQWAIAGLQSSALMLFENFYCSTLFLSHLRGHKVFSSRMYRQQSIAARLRAVFYIATSNFCIPAFLGIFQLTFVLHDRDAMHSAMVLTVNNYISIIGIVFCTLWCASDVWKDTHNHGSSFGPNYPKVIFWTELTSVDIRILAKSRQSPARQNRLRKPMYVCLSLNKV